MKAYNFEKIEKKWQKKWADDQLFKAQNTSAKPKYYILDMFPYPSGEGLHVGHPLGYIATDILARFKRLKGYNVLHPMGFDSFGLPAETYAIRTGQHPAKTTQKNIKRYKQQLENLGFSFDWSREVQTSDPKYYKWTQWIFKLIFESWYNQTTQKAEPISELIEALEKNGNQNIAAACDEDTPIISREEWQHFSPSEKENFLQKYRLTYLSDTMVNWCAALGTVLSNDEVKDGYSERGNHPVIRKKMPQWSMRISAYADRLLEDLELIDWPKSIKEMQKNWIGKSMGAEVNFKVDGFDEEIKIFTTRLDTIFGATFMVLAPELELVEKITTPNQKKEVQKYTNDALNRLEVDRMSEVQNISGVFTGAYAINPFNQEKIPIWIADYVLAGYGTGAVMAVPAHDDRDFRFAQFFKLNIRNVIQGEGASTNNAYSQKEGRVVNSDFLNGLSVEKAIEEAILYAEKKGFGKRKIHYKLRDSAFGRQRYWGEPIPVYYKKGIPTLLDEAELPLELPEIDDFKPTQEGNPPLGRATHWKYKDCPYELTTMPGWAGSSWYFFRYMDAHNDQEFASPKALDYWQSVDFYLGGAEHATGHLLYSRFWTKLLYDRGYVKVKEYAKKLVNQGMIQGKSSIFYRIIATNTFVSSGLAAQYNTQKLNVDTKLVNHKNELDIEKFKSSSPEFSDATFILEKGTFYCDTEREKMSKSKFNVVNPDELVAMYGADTFRMYEMFLGPIEQSKPWNTHGIEGVFKFIKKYWNLCHQPLTNGDPSEKERKILHRLTKKIEDDCENLSLNTSVSAFMVAINELQNLQCKNKKIIEGFTLLLSPFAPHITDEIWHEILGHQTYVSEATFPKYEEKYLIDEKVEYPISINGKVRLKLFFNHNEEKSAIIDNVLQNEIVKKWVGENPTKKVIVVPNKIVNVVV